MQKYSLSEICEIHKGGTGIKKAVPGPYPLVTTAENRSSHKNFDFDCKAVCIPMVSATGHGHASIKRLQFQEGKFALGTILSAAIPKNPKELDAEYLYHYLQIKKDELLVPLMKGSANVSLTIKKLNTVKVEVPEYDKQLKAVKKITNVSEKQNFLFDRFDKQLYEIKLLKESILQEAIQGKLVSQDPNDELVVELLKKIKTEKGNLIKQGKVKKEKPLTPIRDEEIPYKLPKGWEWVRIKDIIYNFGQKKPDKKFTYVDVSAINKEKGFIADNYQNLEPNQAPSRARKIVEKDSVIYSTVRPYLLNIAIVDKAFPYELIVSTAFAVMHPYAGLTTKYLYYYLRSKSFIDFVESKMVGLAYPAINDTQLMKGLLPFPPTKEQLRIVRKIDQLMKLCDELEEKVKQSQKDSEQLMQSVLSEAFN